MRFFRVKLRLRLTKPLRYNEITNTKAQHTEEKTMYIIDFFVNIFKKKNFGTLIWIIINSILVSFFFALLLAFIIPDVHEAALFAIGFAAYVLSIAAALSPLGESILRLQNGCKKITDDQLLARIEPIFYDVYNRALEETPELNRKIKLFVCDEEEPNAFALGRKTICVTRGLLLLSDSEIKAILAHEFGHLAHKDTDSLLVITTGNLIVTVAMIILKTVVKVFNWVFGFILGMVTEHGFLFGLLTSFSNFIFDIVFGGVMWLWTKLGVIICMHSSRQNEFLADKYAYDLGLGRELIHAFTTLEGTSHKKRSLWAAITASHPATDKRIEKLSSYYQSEGYCGNANAQRFYADETVPPVNAYAPVNAFAPVNKVYNYKKPYEYDNTVAPAYGNAYYQGYNNAYAYQYSAPQPCYVR